jgi:uncharacterized protein YeaO (DUF488 family)
LLQAQGILTTGINELPSIWLRRAYRPPGSRDGQRILVDRLWPRGVSKAELKITCWAKDLAPSEELRRWFNHEPDKWPAFQKRYHQELDHNPEAVALLLQRLEKGRITLVFGAKQTAFNNAVALKHYLLETLRANQQ